jgi:pseudouridylate synthase / pseudouridine kinase
VDHSIPQAEIEVAIDQAIRECNRLGIIGKDITPFLLQRVVDVTKGRSLTANIGLIENNARVGADISVALASLNSTSQFQPPPLQTPKSITTDTPVEIMVIGSMAVDLTCTLPNVTAKSLRLHTSLPAQMHTSAGGVAHNVALAASYATSSSVRLITALGTDPEGAWLRQYSENAGLDVSFIKGEAGTARYVAMHDREGELITAAADMRITEQFKEDDIKRSIQNGKPKWLAFDGNLSPSSIQVILSEAGDNTRGICPLHPANQSYSSLLQYQSLH